MTVDESDANKSTEDGTGEGANDAAAAGTLGTVDGVTAVPSTSLASLFENADATSPPRPPPAPRDNATMHAPAPSMVLSGNIPTRPKTISAHNRTVTPHTESLISLFARPPVVPLTPATPSITEERIPPSTTVGSQGDGTPPRLPDYPDPRRGQQHGSITPRKTNASAEKAPPTAGIDAPPWMPRTSFDRPALEREVTPTTRNYAFERKAHRREEHRSQSDDVSGRTSRRSSQGSHNRDETLVSGNLHKSVVSDSFRDTLVAANLKRRSILDDDNDGTMGLANERTGLLNSRNASGCNYGNDVPNHSNNVLDVLSANLKLCDADSLKPTLIGAFLFSLYQLVFCFAEASAITRPSHASSKASALLAPMAFMACVGSLLSAPMLIGVLGGEIPALYPCLDMFMAPFLAQMASDIDAVLAELHDGDGADDDTDAFLATFVALNAFGMLLSGLLCVLAGKVKLANLASFLPYPVLAGFFSSVGISVWMSAFKVDTGVTIQSALASGEWNALLMDFARHAPSVVAGVALYLFGPRGPHYLLGIIASTIAFAYMTMGMTGTSLVEAQDMSFFWKPEEVMMLDDAKQFTYGPPKVFGLWSPAVLGKICWPAFMNGIDGVIAMSVIYLLRCSLHAAALSKCAAKMKASDAGEAHPLSSANNTQSVHLNGRGNNASIHKAEQGKESVRPKEKPKDLLMWYANSLFAVAFSGGFAVLPAIALGGIFSKIGATSRSPQFIAMFLLLGCYLSDFWLCSYVPKCTFSSILVWAAIDMIDSWFIKSYHKSATEWIVVPFIVATSLLYGMLQSVGLGLAASTLIFVASFYRAGVVKFIANGLTIRSTIERNNDDNQWLDQQADQIQILVLQNYLFFGNASSCLKYIQSMFDDEAGHDPDLPPIPKYVILDLSIVTGIDTSAVDVLAEISSLCKDNKCSLIFAGIPRCIRPQLIKGGVKPSRTNRHLSFSPDLDAALGKAEDELLRTVGHNETKAADFGAKRQHIRKMSMVDDGLRHALRSIDTQHNLSMARSLQSLEKYTVPVEIKAGERLNDAGNESNLPRGLYFIEAGLLKCEHDSTASLTRGRTNFFAAPHLRTSTDSIGQLCARSATIGRNVKLLKQNPAVLEAQKHVFRLARIGPGWVVGSISIVQYDIPGTYTALTPCRVHHLTFETIEELEVEQPALILHLYKLLHHLSARRQEMTIGQLATMRSIMSASAPTKPISRRMMKALNEKL